MRTNRREHSRRPNGAQRRLVARWLPPVRVRHPYPLVRFGVMVRRDDTDARALVSRRSSPAGASPASASAGAPSSRPQAHDESRAAQAGCQEPLRREPTCGRRPCNEVPQPAQERPSERRRSVSGKPLSAGSRSAMVSVANVASKSHHSLPGKGHYPVANLDPMATLVS
jgi:hypothetical protein